MPSRTGAIACDPLPRIPPTDIEPVTVNLRDLPADILIPEHQHPWAQLAYPLCGALRMSTADTAWIVPPFRGVWIPPHIRHRVQMFGKVQLRTLYIAPAAAPLPLDTSLVLEVSPLLRALAESLAEGPDAARRALMSSLVLAELGVAPRLPLALPLPADRRLKSLCDAMMDDPASERSLAEWAREVGASERTLARLFSAELGTSFGAWRQQLRLARAVDGIARGHPLARVAADIGYASPAAFSAMFKRALGVPPSRFADAAG